MKLTTKIPFPSFQNRLDYNGLSVFSGSCFSESIGGWLSDLKFSAESNILGISYNPLSLAEHILLALSGKGTKESDLVQTQSHYAHPDFHSIFNRKNSKETVLNINSALSEYRKSLLKADFLFITFGTAIGFESVKTGKIVNNCHRLPANQFIQKMLTVEESYEAMHAALTDLKAKNPTIQIVFTVSPIRHLRHGAVGNMRSKSRLMLLCEKLESEFKNCTYLPIYEFVMDELRGYRFYQQDDLIHLNEMGINLIREKVKATIISPKAFDLMHRIEKWHLMQNHKIKNHDSEEALKFGKKLKKETAELKALLPGRFPV